MPETKYQIGSPNGWRGGFIFTDSDQSAVEIAEGPAFQEKVLDLMETEDEDGKPMVLLVVADEP